MSDDEDMGHASSLPEQLRQAEENDTLPESTADHSSIRLAVKGSLLTAENPIDYLVQQLLYAKRYDGAWNGDEEQAARWAIAQWCQELGWAPDLSAYEAGEQVGLEDDLECCDAVFYGERTVDQEDNDDE